MSHSGNVVGLESLKREKKPAKRNLFLGRSPSGLTGSAGIGEKRVKRYEDAAYRLKIYLYTHTKLTTAP